MCIILRMCRFQNCLICSPRLKIECVVKISAFAIFESGTRPKNSSMLKTPINGNTKVVTLSVQIRQRGKVLITSETDNASKFDDVPKRICRLLEFFVIS